MRSPRSVEQFIRDVTSSKAAQAHYRKRAAELRDEAHREAEAQRPLTARRRRYEAQMLDHAARSEYFDPEGPHA